MITSGMRGNHRYVHVFILPALRCTIGICKIIRSRYGRVVRGWSDTGAKFEISTDSAVTREAEFDTRMCGKHV